MAKFEQVEGLQTHYAEAGEGPPVLLLHGASLGSSLDVWDQVLTPLASHGYRVVAFDQPGFGRTDNPPDYAAALRRQFILKFMDALRIEKACLVGHSQAGNMAVHIAFAHPERVSSVVVVGTGSLLPPLPGAGRAAGEGREGATSEPTLEDTRRLLEANLFDHSLITPQALEQRHRNSTGKNFHAFLERQRAQERSGQDSAQLWQRLDQIPVPTLFMYGKQDRGAAAERAALAKERYPQLNIHVLDRCRHLVQLDAANEFVRLTGEFLARTSREQAPARQRSHA